MSDDFKAKIDAVLGEIVARFEAEFPGRVRGYYLQGSHADGTAVAGSDLDVTVVFKDHLLSDEEREQATKLLRPMHNGVEIDLEVTDEAALLAQADPLFKFSSRLVYGEDIRARLPLVSIESWTRDRMNSSYWRLVKLFNRPAAVTLPLDYPDPADEFYGYIRRRMTLADGSEVLTTRDLIRAVGWAATGLIAFKARQYVLSKAELVVVYQETLHDEWSELIEDVYQRCKLDWNYLIPERRADLRTLCSRVLGFENHFVGAYKDYVLEALQTGDAETLKDTLWILNEIPFQDNQVMEAQILASG